MLASFALARLPRHESAIGRQCAGGRVSTLHGWIEHSIKLHIFPKTGGFRGFDGLKRPELRCKRVPAHPREQAVLGTDISAGAIVERSALWVRQWRHIKIVDFGAQPVLGWAYFDVWGAWLYTSVKHAFKRDSLSEASHAASPVVCTLQE